MVLGITHFGKPPTVQFDLNGIHPLKLVKADLRDHSSESFHMKHLAQPQSLTTPGMTQCKFRKTAKPQDIAGHSLNHGCCRT